MVRHTDTELIVMKKEVYAYRSLKRRGMPHGAMWRSMSVRRQWGERTWPRAFVGVLIGRNGRDRLGTRVSGRLNSLNILGKLCTIVVVPYITLGDLWQGEHWLGVRVFDKGGGWSVGSGLLTKELFAISWYR